MMSETGVLRYQLGGTIYGSLRSVIVPKGSGDANEIAIPSGVASNMRFPAKAY